MRGSKTNAIWKPSVEFVEAEPGHPGCENQLSSLAQSSHYTRTSLRHDSTLDRAVHELNESIREANQAHNSTARPFVRQTSVTLPSSHQEPTSSLKPEQNRPESHLAQGNQSNHRTNQLTSCEREKMSNRLVHEQYNSPMEMYSMNNIRQTIESQSELLAPGLKGINFMKDENPVNKQSEVYKLIKEEEEQEAERRRQQPHQMSPAAHVPRISISQHHQQNSNSQKQERVVSYASERNYSSASQSAIGNQTKAERSLAQAIQQSMHDNSNLQTPTNESNALDPQPGQPKCCECDRFIVGPFARIKDRFVHPHCFNCSTCGTSLKNSGYFTINDKLYCDIHARQVANVMRLNFNFEPNKQTIDNTRQQYDDTTKHKQQLAKQQVVAKHQAAGQELHVSERPNELVKQQQQQQPRDAVENQRCSNCCVTLNNQSATISTMFSNRAGSGCTCGRRGEIRWTWRPCQAQKQRELAATSSSTSNVASAHHLEQQQQQLTRNRYESRLVNATASSSPDRVPVCCHCHVQIQGPYILAGETIWCKPCSQTNFVCSSCHRSLLNTGFIEDKQTKSKYYCEQCFEIYLAPVCAKCHTRIKDQDCLKALNKTWHPSCFVCAHCKCQFGNSSFYLEDNLPYCERDWNLLFTTKCFNCNYPIEAGDKWIEALERSYHSDCFRCAGCQVKLEGTTFYCKGGKPYCRMHAR